MPATVRTKSRRIGPPSEGGRLPEEIVLHAKMGPRESRCLRYLAAMARAGLGLPAMGEMKGVLYCSRSEVPVVLDNLFRRGMIRFWPAFAITDKGLAELGRLPHRKKGRAIR